MSSINAGKVITGGLVAGLVLNVLDFANNALLTGADFAANFTRLGLDPTALESTTAIATWVVIDFLFGILLVWTYAAMRPRFGPWPRTAVLAALVPFIGISLILFGLTQGGLFPMALYTKQTIISFLIVSIGAVAGAWAYKEA